MKPRYSLFEILMKIKDFRWPFTVDLFKDLPVLLLTLWTPRKKRLLGRKACMKRRRQVLFNRYMCYAPNPNILGLRLNAYNTSKNKWHTLMKT